MNYPHKLYVLVVFLLFFTTTGSWGQSLIVGIPSADVAEKNHLEITHETQWNFWQKPNKWNSFNFACFGLGNGTELTATFNNLTNTNGNNLALGLGFKKVFSLGVLPKNMESKFIVGGNALYGVSRQNTGFWAYAMGSVRMPKTQTRFTAGFTHGQSQTFGFRQQIMNNVIGETPNNITTFIGGIEQPLGRNISLIADWYAGTHDLAALIPALQIDVGHHVIILGYKLPNNATSGHKALILECMFSIPTKK